MGQSLSQGVAEYKDPRTSPRIDRPPTFDPLYGFPNGRKVKEMKVTWEEMEKAQLEVGLRDYCAHLVISYRNCQEQTRPFSSHKCNGRKHDWLACEQKEYITRVKEYERERRLLKRKLRKEMKAKAEEQ